MIFRRILKWVAVALAVVALIIGATILGIRSASSTYDPMVADIAETLLPAITAGDTAAVRRYFAPEAQSLDAAGFGKVVKAWGRLGPLQSYEAPVFESVRKVALATYSTSIQYSIKAQYEKGPATVRVIFVRTDADQLRVWNLNVDSPVYLE